MNLLQSFTSDARPATKAAVLEAPQPSFSIQRIEIYAAFEKEQLSDSQVAEASPLVRWAVVALSPARVDLPRRLGTKKPA